METKFSDQEIAALLEERKPLPPDYKKRMQLRGRRGHKERELDIDGAKGSQFRIILRQSDSNLFDFSVILAVNPRGTNQLFRLRRYNGKSHEHKKSNEDNHAAKSSAEAAKVCQTTYIIAGFQVGAKQRSRARP